MQHYNFSHLTVFSQLQHKVRVKRAPGLLRYIIGVIDCAHCRLGLLLRRSKVVALQPRDALLPRRAQESVGSFCERRHCATRGRNAKSIFQRTTTPGSALKKKQNCIIQCQCALYVVGLHGADASRIINLHVLWDALLEIPMGGI